MNTFELFNQDTREHTQLNILLLSLLPKVEERGPLLTSERNR